MSMTAQEATRPIFEDVQTPPLFTPWSDEDASCYLVSDGLRDAVRVAVALGQPLLLTGDPGTGKTQLAYRLAHDLNAGAPLVFDTKTTTAAQDLFYRYDTLRHFHDTQTLPERRPLRDYVEFQALGLAILLAMDPEVAGPFLPETLRGGPRRRSVVLVDEVDKAPTDVPNDLLREFSEMRFQVREGGAGDFPEFRAPDAYRPIVVLTSNSEKSLPDAFLRRCVFYHLEFPDAAQLRAIVRLRLGTGPEFERIDEGAVSEFTSIRQLALKKPPATAEFLGWVRVLRDRGLDPVRDAGRRGEELERTYTVLAKTVEDLRRMRDRAGLLSS